MGNLMMQEIAITKKMYGWSKYGGPNNGLVKEELDIWHCQSCSIEQSRGMAQYMYPLTEDQREFARVCTNCKHIGINHGAITFFELIKFTRSVTYMEKVYISVKHLMM